MRQQFLLTLWLVVFFCWMTSAVQADLPPDPAEWRKLWLEATPEERINLAEQIGEHGARQYARSQGWEPIFDGQGRTVPQGPDMVYRDPRTGKVIVLEAKGGTSPLGQGYGHPQGTRSWAVAAAERILHHPNASPAEKAAAEAIIDAAQHSKLEVQVVRTEHVLGRPKPPVVEKVFQNLVDDLADVHQAQKLADDVARRFHPVSGNPSSSWKQTVQEHADDVAREVFREAPRARVNAARALEEAVEKSLSSGGSHLRGSARYPTAPGGSSLPTAVRPKSTPGTFSSGSCGAVSGGSRAVTGAGVGAAEGAVRGALTTVEAVLGPAVIAFDGGMRLAEAHHLEKAYQRGELSREERDKGKARLAVGFVTSNVGAIGGGYTGATAGAAVGTMIFPGVGTVVGGIIGGIIGGFAGYSAGEAVAHGLVR